ncbi:MAG TPA: hypothetical protein P5511_09205 [Candidatus Goldiibacteriota bacterium]|nr:hypothetical protein [Candidatus Goldiibacteriota bacterium]
MATGLSKSYAKADFDEQIKVFKTRLDRAVSMVHSGIIEDAKTICGIYLLRDIYADKSLKKKFLG